MAMNSTNDIAPLPTRKKLAISISLSLLLVICGVAAFIFLSKSTSRFSADLKNSVAFPLYYPAHIPPGYSIDQKALANQTAAGQIYVILKNGAKTINISEQAKPASNPGILATTFEKNLTGASLASTPYGTAAIGIFSGRTAASLMTDKTWIIVSASPEANADDVKLALQGLKLN